MSLTMPNGVFTRIGRHRIVLPAIAALLCLAAPAGARQSDRDDDAQRYDRDDQQTVRDYQRSDDQDRYSRQPPGTDRFDYIEERVYEPSERDARDDEAFFIDESEGTMRVRGEILDLRTIRLVGMRDPHLFA